MLSFIHVENNGTCSKSPANVFLEKIHIKDTISSLVTCHNLLQMLLWFTHFHPWLKYVELIMHLQSPHYMTKHLLVIWTLTFEVHWLSLHSTKTVSTENRHFWLLDIVFPWLDLYYSVDKKSYWKTNKFSLFLAENPFLTIQHIQFNTFISAATSKLRTSLILVQIKICTSQLHFTLQWSSSILVAPRN